METAGRFRRHGSTMSPLTFGLYGERGPPSVLTKGVWVLLGLLSTCTLGVVAPEGHDVCPQLMYVAGNRDYPYVEGLYLLQEDITDDDLSSDYPVYRHACHDNYLYYRPTHSSWWIGPQLGALSGYALSYSGESDPSRSGASWRYWSHSVGTWLYDVGATLVCLNISCQRLTMVSHQLPPLTGGEFHLTDVIHHDRPVYENTKSGLFLYHSHLSHACNAWLVGSRIGADNAVMHVYDASRDPVEIRANWTLADDQTSTAAYTGADGDGLNVTLVCLELYKYYNTDWRTSRVHHTTAGTNEDSVFTTKEDTALYSVTSASQSSTTATTAGPIQQLTSREAEIERHITVTDSTRDAMEPMKTSLPNIAATTTLDTQTSQSTILTNTDKSTQRGPPTQPGFRLVTPAPTPNQEKTSTPDAVSTSSVPQTAGTTVVPLGETDGTTVVPLGETAGTTVVPLGEAAGTTVVALGETAGTTVVPLGENAGTTVVPLGESTAGNQSVATNVSGENTNRTTLTVDAQMASSTTTIEGINVTHTSNGSMMTSQAHSTVLPLGPTTADTLLPASCGEVSVRRAISFLISGSNSAYQGKWPWMVVILNSDNTTKCGAAVVSARHLVTAAHCIDGRSAAQLASYQVVLGANNRDVSEPGVQTRAIRRVILHHNFSHSSNPFRITNDLGVIELDEPVVFSQYLQPVCLPPSADLSLPLPGVTSNLTSCYITGFGYYQVDAIGRTLSTGGILQEQTVRLETISSCAKRYFSGYKWLATSDNLCVRPNRNAKLCQGDSGSPLMCRQGSQWTLVGVASWSIAACVSGNFPSIYVDLRLHSDWIRQTINNQSMATTQAP